METILVIEDDPALLRGLCANVTASGYTCLHAADGESGLNLALDQRPDLILLDLMMPHMSGYEFIRAYTKEAETPIVILTAKLEENDKVLGLELGADDYVT